MLKSDRAQQLRPSDNLWHGRQHSCPSGTPDLAGMLLHCSEPAQSPLRGETPSTLPGEEAKGAVLS